MPETLAHFIALLIAIFGPLTVLFLGIRQSGPPPEMYLYWTVALTIYIAILIPFTYKSWSTLLKLVFLGVAVEDFFSHVWRSIFEGSKFLPFCNWYTQHFPFLGSLGEPTPLILIPQWYLVAFFIYFAITAFQHRKKLKSLTI